MSQTNENQQELQLVITRTFDAPRKLVFDAFSTPENLAKWWGPKGFDIAVSAFSFETGGAFHYSMSAAGGATMWGKFVFTKIEPPEQIAFINGFSNEQGEITRAPFEGAWPQQMLNSFVFSEENGKTILHLTVVPIDATLEERATFEEGLSSMQGGYGGSFDKLDELLASKTSI
jgi:uncharacterized protein YndB with AHSA1/START domain